MQDPVGDLCQKVGVEKQEIFRRVDSAAELASNARETAQARAQAAVTEPEATMNTGARLQSSLGPVARCLPQASDMFCRDLPRAVLICDFLASHSRRDRWL